MARARPDEPLVPTFGIKLNDKPLIADMALWVVSVVVEDDLDLPSMFALELISKEDEDGTTPWTDDERLALGTAVEISLGYGDGRDPVIVGEITALEPTFSVAGPPTLVVRGYDKRHRLNAAPFTHSYVDATDSQIAQQICDLRHVPIEATDSGVRHAYVLQADQTDLDFLRQRARRIHFELAMDQRGTLLFRPVASGTSSVLTLSLDEDLLEFRPRMALVPLTEVEVLGWDPKEKQTIRASAKAGDELSTMAGERTAAQQAEAVFGSTVETMVRAAAFTQAEADRLALGRFNAAALDFIRGDGRARGRTDLRAGVVIHLDGIGERFSGDYYVTSAVHSYSREGGYLTDFHVRRNAS
jgi:phage protein D